MESFEEKKAVRDGHEIAVQCIMMQLKKDGKIYRPHYHEYIELLYATEGEIEIWLGGRICNFSKGDLVVINSREQHDLRAVTDVGKYIVVKFMPQLLYTTEQSVFELEYILPFIIAGDEHQRVFCSPELKNSNVSTMMHDILTEWDRKEYGYELAMRSDILRVFLWILRYWQDKNVSVVNKFKVPLELNRAIQRSIEYANEHYSDISCDEAAKYCNLSYSYFCRSFKKIMNMSYSDYVNHVRVEAAEKLLVTTELDMNEIATQIGFSTSSYFIDQFKKRKYISPKQFRMSAFGQIKYTAKETTQHGFC